MVFVGTEDYGLVHTASQFQISRDFMCHFAYTVFQNHIVVVIGIVVDAVFNLVAEDIFLTFQRAPTVADIGFDIDDFEGSEKTVVDALLKTIGVEGFSEIVDV